MTHRIRSLVGPWLATGLLGVACHAAAADRCKVLPRAQAETALREIVASGQLARYCTACGDRVPVRLEVRHSALEPRGEEGVVLSGRRFSAAEVHAARDTRSGPLERFIAELDGDPGAREFLLGALEELLAEAPVMPSINGRPVDFATLYVPDADGRWVNLGRRIGCAGEAGVLARLALQPAPPGEFE
jgi:hypothetical protein